MNLTRMRKKASLISRPRYELTQFQQEAKSTVLNVNSSLPTKDAKVTV